MQHFFSLFYAPAKKIIAPMQSKIDKVLANLMSEKGISQIELHRATKVTQSTISRILNPNGPKGIKNPGDQHVKPIADYFRISTDQLRGYIPLPTEEQTTRPGPEIKGVVPLISWVNAGNWAETADIYEVGDAEKWMACPVNHGHRTFVLRVNGPSMDDGTPDGYPDGHLIYVDPDRAYKHNDDVIVKNGEGKTTFKRLICQGSDCWLKPLNPDWPEAIIPVDENCRIIGVVIFSGKER